MNIPVGPLSHIDVSDSELSCRKDVIKVHLDIEKWKKLSDNIKTFPFW